MDKYRWVSKRVADSWLDRYRKEMSEKEFSSWREIFDKTTIVYVDVDGVQFLTKDYLKSKIHSEKYNENNQSKT